MAYVITWSQVDDQLLASQNGPVWVERSQLSRREVVDPLAFLHVDGAIGEDHVGVEPMLPRDGLEPWDECARPEARSGWRRTSR